MSGRITARRVDAIGAVLSTADRELIDYISIAKLLSGKQLRRLTNARTDSEQRQLRRQLTRLTNLRVLSRLGRRIGGVRAGSDGYVYALDVVGQRLRTPTPRRQWRPPWTPSVRVLDHSLAVAELYVQLIEADREGRLELERFSNEPQCWRAFVGPGGAGLVLKPDAFVIVAHDEIEQHAWVECDRSTESLAWITEKAKVYGRYFQTGREQAAQGVFPKTLWIAPDAVRLASLVEALTRLPPEQWQLHQVTTNVEAVSALIDPSDQLIRGTQS